MPPATSRPRDREPLNTEALRPYSESFAAATAASASSTTVTATTGAEGLVAEARHVARDVREHGRLEEVRPEVGARLAAGEHGRALGDGVVDVRRARARAARRWSSEPTSVE